MEKQCNKCFSVKSLNNFYKDYSKKDGLKNICDECSKTAVKNWQKHSEKYKTTSKEYYKNNKDKILKWKQDNKGKVRASKTAYRLSKELRQPKWLSKQDKNLISEFYTVSKEFESIFLRKQEVDHIVPLKGKTVSGLHVPWNLRIVTATENQSKRNSWSWELQR